MSFLPTPREKAEDEDLNIIKSFNRECFGALFCVAKAV